MVAVAALQAGLADDLTTEQVLDLIFRDPTIKHGLSEFDDLGKKPHQILKIFPKVGESGRTKGEVRYYLRCLKRGEDIQVLSEKKANPEEIVRQLWLYKVHHVYNYPFEHLAVEYQVSFGTVTAEKAADIVVFQRDGKTAKIVIEVKRPERKDGINQDVALIRLKKGVHPYFFAARSNSLMGKQLVEQRSTGGINPFLGLGNLRGMPFPVLDPKEHHRIGDLVQETVEKAYEAEQQASTLLEQAKRRVEELIEQETNGVEYGPTNR